MSKLISAIACALAIYFAILTYATQAQPKERFRLVSADDEARYRQFLPATEDDWLQSIFAGELLFYTDKEMPRAYQLDAGAHSPSYNISAKQPTEPYGNANVEFPWGHPGGMHRSPNASAVRFVQLPGPILWWQEQLVRRGWPIQSMAMRWEYPEKTTFAEILLVHDAQNQRHTFEVRTRTKRQGVWRANVFRPFTTRAELDAVLEDRLPPMKLDPPRLTVGRLKSTQPDHVVIDRTAVLDELPELSPVLVRHLLNRPFKSALGEEWIRQGDTPGYAPTTKAPFHIVPKDYDGAYLEIATKACMTCHEGVIEHVDKFDYRREWYGRVRGDDAIFSFHPFEPADISHNGFSKWPRVRQSLVDAGLLKRKE